MKPTPRHGHAVAQMAATAPLCPRPATVKELEAALKCHDRDASTLTLTRPHLVARLARAQAAENTPTNAA